MRHSIISWDCCYRNFFHTASSMAAQEFDHDEYEVVYVEQRTKAASDAFNRRVGLPSLGDVAASLGDRLRIRVVYLGDGPEAPLHWGRAVNAGIEGSEGEIVSVMDGDLLVEPDFLSRLDADHGASTDRIVNLHRRMVPIPLGVPRDRWTSQRVSFDACLEACPDRTAPLPATVQNYGPMISARREHWRAIGGYDDHRIWSTGLSRIGEDVTKRLEMAAGSKARLLPGTVCVHPWHPVGFRRDTFAARRMLGLQGKLIGWAAANGVADWRARRGATDALYNANRRFVERVIRSDVAQPSITPGSFRRFTAGVVGVTARIKHGEFSELKGQLGSTVRSLLPGNR